MHDTSDNSRLQRQRRPATGPIQTSLPSNDLASADPPKPAGSVPGSFFSPDPPPNLPICYVDLTTQLNDIATRDRYATAQLEIEFAVFLAGVN